MAATYFAANSVLTAVAMALEKAGRPVGGELEAPGAGILGDQLLPARGPSIAVLVFGDPGPAINNGRRPGGGRCWLCHTRPTRARPRPGGRLPIAICAKSKACNQATVETLAIAVDAKDQVTPWDTNPARAAAIPLAVARERWA